MIGVGCAPRWLRVGRKGRAESCTFLTYTRHREPRPRSLEGRAGEVEICSLTSSKPPLGLRSVEAFSHSFITRPTPATATLMLEAVIVVAISQSVAIEGTMMEGYGPESLGRR